MADDAKKGGKLSTPVPTTTKEPELTNLLENYDSSKEK